MLEKKYRQDFPVEPGRIAGWRGRGDVGPFPNCSLPSDDLAADGTVITPPAGARGDNWLCAGPTSDNRHG